MTKSSLIEQYCIIEEIIQELNLTLLDHIQNNPLIKFSPDSCFIAKLIMVNKMMLFFTQTIEFTDLEDEFFLFYSRAKKHLQTTDEMLQQYIH